MSKKGVYVVTNPELGWDCVVSVFDASTCTEEEVRYMYDEDYVISYTSFREIERPPVLEQTSIIEITEKNDYYDPTMECIIDNLEIVSDNQKLLYSKPGSTMRNEDCHILAKIFLDWLEENGYPNYGGEVVVVKTEKYSYVGMKFKDEHDLNAFNHGVRWFEDFNTDYLENDKEIELS